LKTIKGNQLKTIKENQLNNKGNQLNKHKKQLSKIIKRKSLLVMMRDSSCVGSAFPMSIKATPRPSTPACPLNTNSKTSPGLAWMDNHLAHLLQHFLCRLECFDISTLGGFQNHISFSSILHQEFKILNRISIPWHLR
jgi:hypothetical protein